MRDFSRLFFRFELFVLVLAVLLFAVQGIAEPAAVSADWPTWRHDAARSAFTPTPLPEELHLLWTRQLAPPISAWPTNQHKLQFDASYEPIIAGKRMFTGSMSSDTVTAYDMENGDELWRFYADGPVRFAPLAWRDRLFAISDDGFLYCLDQASGKLRWSKRLAPDNRLGLGNFRLASLWPVRGAPVLWEAPGEEATLYVGASIWPFMGIFLYALDAETGDIRWSNSGSGSMYVTQQHYSPAFAGVAPQGYFAATEDLLLVSGGRTVPAAFDRHTGEFRYFEVSARDYGKDAGGYEVGVVARNFFNHGCLYNLTNAAPVINLNDEKNMPGHAVVRLGDGFALLGEHSLGMYGATPERFTRAVTNRKGKVKTSVSFGMPALGNVELGRRAEQAHFRAGDRVYLSDSDGWIAAVDVPPAKAPGISWEAEVDGKVWTMLGGDGKLVVVTEEGVLHVFGAASPADGAKKHVRQKSPLPSKAHTAGPEGYAMLWGPGPDAFAGISALARMFHVIAVEPDADAADLLRRRLDDAGLYGLRAHVLIGTPVELALPPYLADYLEIGEGALNDAKDIPALARQAWRILRPYGGRAVWRGSALNVAAMSRAITDMRASNAQIEKGRDEFSAGVVKEGQLPGAASWTHQYADVGNTVISRDDLVKPPLGLLWFGGPPHDDILPRHGHGPSPQVVGGRLFIEGPHALRAVDVYNGRMLWQKELPDIGLYYDTTLHQPGAGEIGGNYVSLEDGIYVAHAKKALRLDPATGRTISVFSLPGGEDGEEQHWGYIGVYEDLLIAGATPFKIKEGKKDEPDKIVRNAPYAASSTRLVVMDRHSGEVLWERSAELAFRHNAIVAGAGKIFCIDGLPASSLKLLERRGEKPTAKARLLALDARTGKEVWVHDNYVFGTWLGYSEALDLLLEAGSPARDRATDEAKGQMAAFCGADGHEIWRASMSYAGTPMLHHDTIFTDGGAFALATGKTQRRANPLTERLAPWGFTRNYGCNTPIGGQHLLLFRSAAAGFYDLTTAGGTGNWGGFKSGCTANLIPADGVLNAPDYTRTCTCSYQNQCSLALTPMDDVEIWTFQAFDKLRGRILRMGVNFGAPGDWPTPEGTLWLEYPVVGGPGPDIDVELEGDVTYFRKHSLEMTGPAPQVTASGLEGEALIKVPVNGDEPRDYEISLYFSEPGAADAGERVFDVFVQGKPAVEALDVAKRAGAARKGIVVECGKEPVSGHLTVELRKRPESKFPPLLCGVKLFRAEPVFVDMEIPLPSEEPDLPVKPGFATARLIATNRTDAPVTVRLAPSFAETQLPPISRRIEQGAQAVIPLEIPSEALNAGEQLKVVYSVRVGAQDFPEASEVFPLELPVPLEIKGEFCSRQEARFTLRSSAMSNQTFRFTVELSGAELLNQELSLKPGASEELPCALPAEIFYTQSVLQATARWPAEVMPAPCRYSLEFDFSKVKTLPKLPKPSWAEALLQKPEEKKKPDTPLSASLEKSKDADDIDELLEDELEAKIQKKSPASPMPPDAELAPVPGALSFALSAADGLFPEAKRSTLEGSDDLEATMDLWWDGEAIVVIARVKDDAHFNPKTGADIWDGDCAQVGIAPASGHLSNLAFALADSGPSIYQYEGKDKSLAGKTAFSVYRDDAAGLTLYRARIPLRESGIIPQDGVFFRMNAVFFDDDEGKGFAYWRQLTPGLAGGVKPAEYHLFMLGE